MRILIEGTCSRVIDLAARLCLAGHDVALPGSAADITAEVAAAIGRIELPLARLSDHPLPLRGGCKCLSDRPDITDAFDLHLHCSDRGVTVAAPFGPLRIDLPKAAWLPFCHLPQPAAEVEAVLTAAGFLIAAQSEIRSLDALALAVEALPRAERDLALGALLRSLRDQGLGPGARLLAQDRARPLTSEAGPDGLVRLRVLPSWIDYNGHMTESRYLAVCSEVTDVVLRRAGFDLSYVAGGFSYYTVETHLRHLRESKIGQEIQGETRVLGVDARRLHLLTTLRVEGEDVATLEQMLVHVDMAAGRACAAPEAMLSALRALAKTGAGPVAPDWLGRGVRGIGQARG